MPVVTIGDNTADDFSGNEFNHLRSSSATNNYGAYSYGYCSDSRFILIKFSGLSNISGPVTVNSAYIYLYTHLSYSVTNNFRRLLRDWIEGTQAGGDRSNDTPYSSCYNEYGDGNSWTSGGGTGNGTDRVSAVSATITDGGSGYNQSTDLSSDVEDFINGDESNYGWHLHGTSTQLQWLSDDDTDTQRPYLEVDYTAGGGGANPKGVFGLPLRGCFGGHI